MKRIAKIIQFSAALLLIFLCIAKAVYAPLFVPVMNRCYKYIIVLMALTNVYLLRLGQGAEVKLTAAYWVWLLITRLLLGRECLAGDRSMLVDTAVYVLLLSVGQMAGARNRLRLADITACILALPAAVSAAVCLMGSLHRTPIFYPSGDAVFTLFDLGRLMVFGLDPNTSSMWFFLGASMTVYLALRFRWLTWLAVPAVLLNGVAIGLTGSRSVMFASAVCLPLLVILLVLKRFDIQKRGARAATVLAVLLVLAPLTYRSFSLSNCAVAALSERLVPVSTEAAFPSPAALSFTVSEEQEEAATQSFPTDRGFGDTGRILTWKTALYTLKAEPKRLLIGCDMAHLMDYSNPILEKELHFRNNNYHNMLINLLVATGLPGMLLVLSMLILLAVKLFRLYFADLDLAVKSLILPVAAAYIYNMLEAVLFFRTDFRTLPVFLLMGLLIAECTETDKLP